MLTARIAGLIGLALVPALLTQVYNLHAMMVARDADVRSEAGRYTHVVAGNIEQYGDALRGALGILAQVPALRGGDPAACKAALDMALGSVPGAFLLAVADATGEVACNTEGSAPGTYSIAARGYFQEAMRSEGLAVGDYVKGILTGKPTIQVARSLRDESGRPTGIVLASIDLGWLSRRLRQPGLPHGASLTVADRTGIVLAREPVEGGWIGRQLPAERLAARKRAGDQPVVSDATGLDGKSRIAGMRQVSGSFSGLSVVVGIDREVAFENADATLRREGVQILLGLLLAVGAAFLAGRHFIRKPVERLSRAAMAWEKGQLDIRTMLSGQTELGRLGQTFDRMAASLQRHEAELRDEVARGNALRERQTIMLHELNHRVKNTLAVVQSLSRQARNGDDGPESLERRILALSKTHDLLTRSEWSAAPLRVVLENELGPYRDGADRCTLTGPGIDLPPRFVLALGMTVHELTTNAAKYGALSLPGGSVGVSWETREGPRGRELRLRWRETGGPLVVTPKRRGFGTRLIAAGITQELGGDARLDFAPQGLDCEIVVPLAETPAFDLTQAA